MTQRNHFDQIVGDKLPHWKGVKPLPENALQGQYCRLIPLDVRLHAQDLLHAFSQAEDARDWTWLAGERPDNLDAMTRWVVGKVLDKTVIPFAVIDLRSGSAVGVIAWLAIVPQHGSVEIGHVTWSPLMKKSVLGTEAVWLLLRAAFDCGYRRVEWKCDSLNHASRRAAERIGFTWEGRFRQHMVRDGRNRDSDYLSIIDSEWSQRNAALSGWLAAANFDQQGRQIECLEAFHVSRDL
ncbi:GNAT family N-acetyltransferase [Salmonella enterica]